MPDASDLAEDIIDAAERANEEAEELGTREAQRLAVELISKEIHDHVETLIQEHFEEADHT